VKEGLKPLYLIYWISLGSARNHATQLRVPLYRNQQASESQPQWQELASQKLEDIIARTRQPVIVIPYIIHPRPERKVQAKSRDHQPKFAQQLHSPIPEGARQV